MDYQSGAGSGREWRGWRNARLAFRFTGGGPFITDDPDRSRWHPCTKLGAKPVRDSVCRGQVGILWCYRKGHGYELGWVGPSTLVRYRSRARGTDNLQLLVLRRMKEHPNLCSRLACDWCGAEMTPIAPIETGLFRGKGLTWLCRCGHELERIGTP